MAKIIVCLIKHYLHLEIVTCHKNVNCHILWYFYVSQKYNITSSIIYDTVATVVSYIVLWYKKYKKSTKHNVRKCVLAGLTIIIVLNYYCFYR